ncbi:MAG: GNAT family N-acetyltransferase [Angustibacter sp.]
MASGVAVRRATPADSLLVGQLLFDFNVEFGTPTPSAADFAARFEWLLARDDVVVLLAEQAGGQSRGFAFLTLRPTPYADGPLGQLEELYVQQQFRGHGIGSRLLAEAVAVVRERAGGEVHINVDEPDVDTRRFYERHGFVNVQPGTDDRMLCYLQEL